MTQKIKKYILIFLLAHLVLGYSSAYAQSENYIGSGVEAQIKEYLCTPNEAPPSQTSNTNGILTGQQTYQDGAAAANNNSGVLYQCINQVYKFAIVIASVVAVFFIVIAGYIYMSSDGDQEAVSKAKSILASSIASIVILLVGYVLLKALNPDLVEFHSVQPPSVVMPSVQGVPSSGTVNFNAGVCAPNRGECQVSAMSSCTWDPNFASAVCGLESGGGQAGISSGVDLCMDGTSFSIGLMQMNVISNGGKDYMPAECPAGIFESTDGQRVQSHIVERDSKNANHWNCRIAPGKQQQYQACRQALSQPAKNLTAACALFKIQGWGAWKTSVGKCTAGVTQTNPGQTSVATSACTPSSSNQTQTGGMLLIGDSLMHGMNSTFASKGKVNTGSYCNDGDSISAALSKISGKISTSAAPNVAFISLGTNNYSRPVDALADQAKLINAVKQTGAKKIVWVGPPKFPQPNTYGITAEQNRVLNDTLKSGASSIIYYDTYNSGLSLYQTSSSALDIHPSNYPAWANALWGLYGN